MAKIEIVVDTENKDQSTVTIDGKKIENVNYLCIYSFGHKEYMSIEIETLKRPEKNDSGEMTERTILTASKKTGDKLVKSDSILTQKEREELTKVVQSLCGK